MSFLPSQTVPQRGVCQHATRKAACVQWRTARRATVAAAAAAPRSFVPAAGEPASAGRPEAVVARAYAPLRPGAQHAEPAMQSAVQEGSASKCPFSQLSAALAQATNPGELAPGPSARQQAGSLVAPGPPPLSLEALKDVSIIFLEGLHVAMLKFSEKYGPVCRFANPASLNGATSWVFLNSPDNIQHVCATNVRNYGRRYLPDIYKFVTHEKGILGSQDDYNTRHRRLCSGPFRSRAQLQRFASVVVDRSQQLVQIFDAAAAGQASGSFETDVAVQTQRLTLDVVGLVAFSHDFHQVDQVQRDLQGAANGAQATDRVLWAVNTFGEVLAEIFITPLPLLQLLDRMGFPHLRQLGEAVGVMRRAMLDVIQDRRELLAAGRNCPDDLLQSLLTATDDAGRGMTDEELWEDVHDIMGAGHETTATTTAALIYCISAHPEVQRRVEQELDEVLGGEAPTFESLERLPYLQACAKEVMRLYPAIPVFPREAAKDDVLPSGHSVAAGDVVFMSSYALGRSAALWPEPLKFDPDRFSPEAEARQHRFQWLPFGAGPRMCLGASFAQMSVSLMAATLLHRFRFTPKRPTTGLIPAGYDITLNFNPTGGLRMAVGPRTRAVVQQPSSASLASAAVAVRSGELQAA